MKKFYILLSCFAFLTCALQAQSFGAPNPTVDPEKIYLFDVDIQVQPDGNIQVTENITLNVKHQQINRGIYRDLPVSLKERAHIVSLTMDGEPHPFFTQKQTKNLRVNFGNDDFISTGKHTYSFTYNYTGAINFLKDYDELYWNVTGNYWNFVIDKARAKVSFPSNVNIQKNGISFYTGQTYSKQQQAIQTAPLTFETTAPLDTYEGFTIAIPFDKGAIQPPSTADQLKHFLISLPFWLSLILFIILIRFCFSSWLKVGRDPLYRIIPQYDPPKDISPAFMYYFYHRRADAKLLACAILDLAMKGQLEVKEEKGFFTKKTTLHRIGTDSSDLPYDEQRIIRRLFGSAKTCTLDKKIGEKLETIRKEIEAKFTQDIKRYVVSNGKYVAKAGALALALGVLPFIFFFNFDLIFINFHFAVLFLVFAGLLFKSPFLKIIIGLLLTAFYSLSWMADGAFNSLDTLMCLLFYLAGMWIVALYASLIANVTPQGQSLFEQIHGFKKYVKTAELHRVAASNPHDSERIFCSYLPFAFALGLQNQWMKKFTKVLSKATLDKCMKCAGGIHTVSRGLSSSVGSSMPSGGHGGSHGGGCSGGGHGGGGGGGR